MKYNRLTAFKLFAMTSSMVISVDELAPFGKTGATALFYLLIAGIAWFIPKLNGSTLVAFVPFMLAFCGGGASAPHVKNLDHYSKVMLALAITAICFDLLGSMAIGIIGELGNWIAGPNQGMYEAAREGYMPKFFAKTTKHGVPIRIMILQSSIVTISALLITFTSGTNADFAFNVSLAATTAQYLLVYMIMLIAHIVLKRRHEDYHRMYYMSKNPNTSIAIAILALIITVIAFFVPA